MSAPNTNTTLPNCGNLVFPLPCPLPPSRPIDGHGGPCYTLYFPVPTCHNTTYTNNDPSMINPPDNNIPPQLTWHLIDEFYATNATSAIIQGIILGLMLITFVNILVLTPERKRSLLVYWAVLGSVGGMIIRSGIGTYLEVYGAGVSAYLQLTGEWDGTEWSVLWGVLVTMDQVVACLVLVGVNVAFWCQCRGLLVWVRIRFGRGTYQGVLGVLCALGGVSCVLRIWLAVYEIVYVAFPQVGVSLLAVWERINGAKTRSAVVVGVALGCWSLVFVISATWLLWDRRRGILSAGLGGGGGGINMGRKVGNICNKALDLVAFVGMKSFIIPFVLSILTAVPLVPMIEVVLVPVVLASLPLSSLLVPVNERGDQPQEAAGGLQFEMVSKHKGIENMSAKLDGNCNTTEYGAVFSNRSGRRDGLLADISIDRELHEIDSIK